MFMVPLQVKSTLQSIVLYLNVVKSHPRVDARLKQVQLILSAGFYPAVTPVVVNKGACPCVFISNDRVHVVPKETDVNNIHITFGRGPASQLTTRYTLIKIP